MRLNKYYVSLNTIQLSLDKITNKNIRFVRNLLEQPVSF